MKFENIQSKEDLKNFFTSNGFEIQKHDENLIKIDKSHFLQVKTVDVLDHDTASKEHKDFKKKFRDIPYQLLVDRTLQKFIFQRDYGTPLRFTYDRTKDYARETKGSIFKKLNLLKFEDSDFNTTINNLFDIKEIVNKFYEEYKKIRKKLGKAIKNLDGDPYLYAQIIMDRIIFLYFLQTKSVLSKTFLSDLYYNKKRTENFYHDYLIPLFFQMLNTEKHSKELEKKFGLIPYLNGGLFSPKDIETKNGNAQISDSIWDYVFKLLNGYEWVIEEEKGDSTTLTPSILGHIYEKSVIAATQKETGSYYTPEEITTYISKNTIYPYITDKVNEKFGTKYKYIWNELLNKTQHTKEEIEYVKYLYNILKNLKICDNACGSGAFLIAAQQILLPIYWACIKILLNKPLFREEVLKLKKYRNWNYFLKKEIITKNLYGVDIQEGAIEIAKLRLWLSMVSEMELKAEDIEPLPNIDYNLLTGNSLIGYIKPEEIKIKGAYLEPKVGDQQKLIGEKEKQMKFVKGIPISEIMKAKQILIERYREESKSEFAQKIRKDIENMSEPLRKQLDEKLLQKFLDQGIKITKDEFDKLKPFHWSFEFYDIFNCNKNGEEKGFDIIIGNPPYFSIDPKLKRISNQEHLFFRKNYKTFHGQTDIFVFFYERVVNLLKKEGILGFISKNRWQDSPSYKNFCDYLSDKNLKILDFDDTFVFIGVGVTTNIILIDKNREPFVEYWLFDNSGLEKIFDPFHYNKYKHVFSKKEKWELLSNEITKYVDKTGKKILVGGCGHKITPAKFFIIRKISKTEFEPEDLEIKSYINKIKLNNKELNYVLRFTSSGNIFSYYINDENRYIFYLRNIDINSLPNIKTYFNKIKPKKSCRRWYEFHCGHGYRNIDLIELKEKIIFPHRMYLNRKCSFYLDFNKTLIGMDCEATIINEEDVSNKFVLPILNSNLMWYYIRRKFKRYANRQTVSIEQIPIKILQNQQQFITLCDYILFLNKTEERRNSEKELIEFIDKQIIDSLVYELYFKEELKTNLLQLVELHLKDIKNLKSNEEKLKTIKQVVEKIKSDNKILKEIEKIKNHKWVKIIEGEENIKV